MSVYVYINNFICYWGKFNVSVFHMTWFRCFRLAIGPVHISCRQWRGTIKCEHWTGCWKQSKEGVASGPQEETLPRNWWVNDTINSAWLYVVVACRMSSCGGGMAVYVVCMNWSTFFHLPSVPYIYVADDIVAPTRVNAEPSGNTQSSRGAVHPGFQFPQITQLDETGELMTPSIVHGDILLWLVEWLLVGVHCLHELIQMFPLAIGPVHICCRQYRGTNPCERGAQCGHGRVGWTQSKSVPPGRQEETLYSNWWVNDTIIRAWRYIVVACRMSSCRGGDGCVHCLHELIQMFPTWQWHRSRTYILQTMTWHNQARALHGLLNAVKGGRSLRVLRRFQSMKLVS